MKCILIQALSVEYFTSVSNSYQGGEFRESYMFHGVGEYSKTGFFVTHGSPEGYFVMDCSGDREATYSNKNFGFYMLGLLMDNNQFSDIEKITTIECYGGFHKPCILPLSHKKIVMSPLSDQKTILWAGWRISKMNNPYFACVIFKPEELDEISNNQTGFFSVSPITNERVGKFEGVSYQNQLRFVKQKINECMNKIVGDEDFVIL